MLSRNRKEETRQAKREVRRDGLMHTVMEASRWLSRPPVPHHTQTRRIYHLATYHASRPLFRSRYTAKSPRHKLPCVRFTHPHAHHCRPPRVSPVFVASFRLFSFARCYYILFVFPSSHFSLSSRSVSQSKLQLSFLTYLPVVVALDRARFFPPIFFSTSSRCPRRFVSLAI